MMNFNPKFTITNRMTQAITRIERARGFLDAACLPSGPHRQAQLSADWVREVGEQALILEAHHTTHIEGTRLTLGNIGDGHSYIDILVGIYSDPSASLYPPRVSRIG